MAKKKRKGKHSVSVDFSGVTERKTLSEGLHLCEVRDVSLEEGPNAPYLKFAWDEVDGPGGCYDNVSLSPKALWRLFKLMKIMGFDPPKGEMDVDFSEFITEKAVLEIEHEDYNDKPVPRVIEFYPEDYQVDDVEDEDEEEVEDEEEEETEEAEDEDDEDEDPETWSESEVVGMSSKALNSIIDEADLDQSLMSTKPVRKKRAAVVEALRDAELLDED